MARGKGKSFVKAPIQPKRTFSEKHRLEEENESESDLEYYNDMNSSSMNAHLLFTKESLSSSSRSGPLFPDSSRDSFLIMTCKRTVFACRGLFLFGFIVFLVITVVASYGDTVDRNGRGGDSPVIVGGNHSSNGSEKVGGRQDHHQLTKLPVPFGEGAGGNVNEVEVKFNANCSYRKVDFADIGNSLRRAIEFYEKNVDNITVLDAALGTKIVTEQIRVIKQLHPKLPSEITAFLHTIGERAESLTAEITETVRRSTNETEDLKYTLPWLETKDLWHLPINGSWYASNKLASYNPPDGESFENLWDIASRREAIDEFVSDSCIFQVFHCRTINITQECQDAFVNSISSMYSLTHQVIYMLLARKNNCFEVSSWKQVSNLGDNGDLILERMCGKVWQEANSIMESNYPPRFRDLLIEQVGMCSLAGYTEFLRRDWLRRLLFWQGRTTSGCFGERRRRIPPTTMELLLKNYQRRQMQDRQVQFLQEFDSPNDNEVSSGRGRYKRSDMYLEDDQDKCSVHFTSVAITAISIHLRYFFDTCLDAY